jgi:septum formation protein
MLRLVLASQSPRRRDLLTEAGFDFLVDPVKVSEIIDENVNPEAAVLDLALQKAMAALDRPKYLEKQGFLILAADTVVVAKDRVFGKPENKAEAVQFLTELGNKTHRVMTALYLACSGHGPTAYHVEVSHVTFRSLSPSEIQAYVESGEPMDKAGAYAIQGEGRKFVSRLEGSWSNVVGLPMEALESLLKRNGWQVSRK